MPQVVGGNVRINTLMMCRHLSRLLGLTQAREMELSGVLGLLLPGGSRLAPNNNHFRERRLGRQMIGGVNSEARHSTSPHTWTRRSSTKGICYLVEDQGILDVGDGILKHNHSLLRGSSSILHHEDAVCLACVSPSVSQYVSPYL